MNKGTKQAFQYVVPKTIPVLVGYLFLGAAYGILMQVNGFGIGWTLISSIFIYAGSLQYLEVTLLVGLVSPVYAFLIGLMINARHLFYGISLLNKYRDVKKGKPYLIFALTDETFSVICDENVPETLEQDKVFFWITFLDQCYWVMGSAMGALVGGFLTFNTQGLDFALTALFVVIFTDQWKHQKNHRPAFGRVLLKGNLLNSISIWTAGAFCGGADRGASLVEGKFPVKHWCRNGILYVPGSGGFLIRDFGKKWIKFLVGL